MRKTAMKKGKLRDVDSALRLRFIAPVVLEQVFLVIIKLVISQTFSSISKSSLAAISLSNQIFTVMEASFEFLTTGLGVVTARLVGAGEYEEAEKTAERTLFFVTCLSVIAVVLCEIFASPLIRLFAQTDDAQLTQEALRYFRILIISLVPMVIMNALFFIMRSKGNSFWLLIAQIIVNLSILAFASIFVRALRMNEDGAAYAYLIARVVGMVFAVVFTARDKQYFRIRFSDCLKPDFSVLRRLTKVGLPISLQSVIVQIGYLLNNSLSIGLSTVEAGAYSITSTVHEFSSIPWSPVTHISRTVNGHLLGAKKYPESKRATTVICIVAMLLTLVLDVIVVVLARPISGIYSDDQAIIDCASKAMFMLFFVNVLGTMLNSLLPKLLAAGDTKYVAVISSVSVLFVRIPFSVLFTRVVPLGIIGLHLANVLSISFRTALVLIRLAGHKYLHERV